MVQPSLSHSVGCHDAAGVAISNYPSWRRPPSVACPVRFPTCSLPGRIRVFWSTSIDSCPDSKTVWKNMNSLLNPVTSTSTPHFASEFNNLLTGKFDAIRAATVAASAPNIVHRDVPHIDGFGVVSLEEVTYILRCISGKQYDLDPIPTILIKSMCDVFSPIIDSMVNTSFEHGIFPSSHKHAFVRPSLYPLHIKSFRPISNCSFISKVVQRLSVNRLSEHTS